MQSRIREKASRQRVKDVIFLRRSRDARKEAPRVPCAAPNDLDPQCLNPRRQDLASRAMYAVCLWMACAVAMCVGTGASAASAADTVDTAADTVADGDDGPDAIPRLPRVDDSWPVQSLEAFRTHATPARQQAYAAFMQGCGLAYGADLCTRQEKARLAVNARQPALLRNLTATGYAKVRMPPHVLAKLRDHLLEYQENLVEESWGASSTLVNHWEADTDVHHLAHYMALADRQLIQRDVQDMVEEWCGLALTPVSMYGIRIYRRGAVVAPHVDRLPLVVSAILHIATQDDNSYDHHNDWPLQVIGRNGVAVNLTLQPGEMILYESASILHGRPYPLPGW
jgi:hypothetical protein